MTTVFPGCDTATLTSWEDKSAPMMQLLHLCGGIGTLVTTQMIKPFLTVQQGQNDTQHLDKQKHSSLSNIFLSNVTQSMLHSQNYELNTTLTTHETLNVYGLEVPYSIAAGVAFLTSLALVGLFIKGPPPGFPSRKPIRNIKNLVSPGSCTENDTSHGIILLILCIIYTIFSIGGERVFLSYLFSYAVEADVSFSKSSAADLTTVFCATFLVGRLLAVFLTHIFPVEWVLVVEVVCGLATMVVGAALAFEKAAALWFVSGMAGLFISALMPGGMAWINIYLKVK